MAKNERVYYIEIFPKGEKGKESSTYVCSYVNLLK